ncbi:MAG: hypothetical protein J6R33_03225, partial [Clostridia bacterium]|nr:hypothetical protein [Clostridia bacterium]
REVFESAAAYAKVIYLPENTGKGAALKYGMSALLQHFPECRYFTTADADGQHTVEDIMRINAEPYAQASMVLSTRDLSGDIPARSRFGNDLSKWVYTLLTGHYFMDNQSGLRRFSVEHIGWLLRVDGTKYDYEMNVLYHADKQHIPITTMPIRAIYIDGNKSSHFNPVADTIRIYRRLFYSARASISTALFCEALMLSISVMWGYRMLWLTMLSVGITAAVIAELMNVFLIFRYYKYRNMPQALLNIIIRFGGYATFCWLISLLFPTVPLIITYNVAALAGIPIRYAISKWIWERRYHQA